MTYEIQAIQLVNMGVCVAFLSLKIDTLSVLRDLSGYVCEDYLDFRRPCKSVGYILLLPTPRIPAWLCFRCYSSGSLPAALAEIVVPDIESLTS